MALGNKLSSPLASTIFLGGGLCPTSLSTKTNELEEHLHLDMIVWQAHSSLKTHEPHVVVHGLDINWLNKSSKVSGPGAKKGTGFEGDSAL